jgi:hypothetical protein
MLDYPRSRATPNPDRPQSRQIGDIDLRDPKVERRRNPVGPVADAPGNFDKLGVRFRRGGDIELTLRDG